MLQISKTLPTYPASDWSLSYRPSSMNRERQQARPHLSLFRSGLAALVLLYWPSIVSADYDNYRETFDGWPDSTVNTGCGSGSPPSACNGSEIGGTGNGVVAIAPGGQACRGGSGKCWFYNMPQEGNEFRFLPKGGGPASRTAHYMRFYVRFAKNPWGPGNMKLARFTNGTTLSLTMGDDHISLDEPTKCFTFFDADRYTMQWIKMELWITRSGSNYTAQTWVTPGNDPTITSGQCNFSFDNTMDGLIIMLNSSGANRGNIWLDDFCAGNSLSDRTGFCAEVRPNPPVQMPVQ